MGKVVKTGICPTCKLRKGKSTHGYCMYCWRTRAKAYRAAQVLKCNKCGSTNVSVSHDDKKFEVAMKK